MKKWFKKAVFTTTAVLALAACSSEEEKETVEAAAEGTKVVHVAQNIVPNKPYSFFNEKNEMDGYTVDYLKTVDELLKDYTFEYDQVEADAMLVGTETGKYDLAANYYYLTPERKENYLLGESEYGYTYTSIVTKANEKDIQSFEDLGGRIVSPLNPGGGTSVAIKEFNEKNPDHPILIDWTESFADAEAFKGIDAGKYDAWYGNSHNFDVINESLKLDLKIAAYVSKEPIWVLFNKDNEELVTAFNEATKQLKEDGTLAELSNKWFGKNYFEEE